MTNDYPTTAIGAELERRTSPAEREWIELMGPAVTLAKHVADTAFVPRGLRGNPPAIVAAIMYGDELGLGPMQALARIAVIDGRPTLAAETQRALVLAAGHELWIEEASATRVTVSGRRRDSDRTSSVTWTADDAKRAALSAKPSWRAYPRQMLTARATAELVRTIFADVTGGLVATEELDDELVLEAEAADADGGEKKPTTRRRRRKSSSEGAKTPESSSPVDADVVGSAEDDATAAALLDELNEAAGAPVERELHGEHGEVVGSAVDVDLELELERERQAKAEADNIAELERMAKADEAEPATLTDPQRRKMNALFRELDITARPARLSYCSTVTRRDIKTSSELTIDEAGRVIEALEAWQANPSGGPFQDGIPY